jgi:hypothetical protein
VTKRTDLRDSRVYRDDQYRWGNSRRRRNDRETIAEGLTDTTDPREHTMPGTDVFDHDDTKHLYELLVEQDGQERYPFIIDAETRTESGLSRSVGSATKLLAEHPEFDRVKVYHTYPSPGPQRRYAGVVTRDNGFSTP